jgi:hypothetical protein
VPLGDTVGACYARGMETLRTLWCEGGPLAWTVVLVLFWFVIGCFTASARRATPCLQLHVFIGEHMRILERESGRSMTQLLKDDTADGWA